MTRRESQRVLIARHLKKYKSINWMIAETKYGVKRLAARIGELKKIGIPISSKIIYHGREVKFARYTLMSSK